MASPNRSTDSSPQNVLTCNLASGQETVATRFIIDLGLAELRNVRDRVEKLRRLADSLILRRGSARLEAT